MLSASAGEWKRHSTPPKLSTKRRKIVVSFRGASHQPRRYRGIRQFFLHIAASSLLPTIPTSPQLPPNINSLVPTRTVAVWPCPPLSLIILLETAAARRIGCLSACLGVRRVAVACVQCPLHWSFFCLPAAGSLRYSFKPQDKLGFGHWML